MKPEEIYDKFKDMKYGYFDKNGSMLSHISDGFLKYFRSQTIEHLEEYKTGTCWETVELLRYYLEKNGYECKSYFFVIPYGKFYNHALITYKNNNKYCWMEISLSKLNGIREYDSLKDLFFDLLDHFDIVMPNKEISYKDMKITEYSKVKENSSCLQFFYHCFGGKNITKDYIPEYLKYIAQKQNK